MPDDLAARVERLEAEVSLLRAGKLPPLRGRDLLFEEQFWPSVWLKVGKDAARRAWLRKATKKEKALAIIEAAKAQGPRILDNARRQNITPIHPATWLNAGRYEDELPAAPKPTPIDEWLAKQAQELPPESGLSEEEIARLDRERIRKEYGIR